MKKKKEWSELPCAERSTENSLQICKIVSDKLGRKVATDPTFCDLCIQAGGPRIENNRGLRLLEGWNESRVAKKKFISTEEKFGEGPGTELHKIIPAFLERKGCSCRAFAKKMNIWGIEGCEQRIEKIVDKLVAESRKRAIFAWVPDAATRTVARKMADTAIQRAKEKQGLEKHKWFVAVTTAPRKDPTLQTCLDSLLINGWNPYIFAEPGVYDVEQAFKENLMMHTTRKGVWWNWIESCRYALNNSDAEIIMTVQDDSLFHPDSKKLAESFLWPREDVGFISLYTPKHYSIRNHLKSKPERPIGLNRIATKALWGACAMVWPRKVLEQVMEHELIEGWLGAPLKTKSAWEERQKKRREEPWTIQNSDTAIGKIMNRMNRSMWFVDPSPVQHIAEHSAINHGGNKGRRNCGRCAKFSTPIFDQVPLHVNGMTQDFIGTDEIAI